MNDITLKLIEAARGVVGDLKLGEKFSAGGVGAPILTAHGNVYTGICIDFGSDSVPRWLRLNEPVIRHVKSDHQISDDLKRIVGNQINALLCGCIRIWVFQRIKSVRPGYQLNF